MPDRNATSASLAEQVARAYEHALECAAILPLRTDARTFAVDGAHFVVKCISSQSLKGMAGARQRAPNSNPFLPYDEDLFVADLSATHVLLLNKFPLQPAHVLAVTRGFVAQTMRLQAADFEAMAALLMQARGVAAYNGGSVAGASQPHRHLHFVLEDSALPLEPLFPLHGSCGTVDQVGAFRFVHAFMRIDPKANDAAALALHLQLAYEDACRHCGISERHGELSPYNLLATRHWLLLVPRSQECWTSKGESVSLNAFAYAGMLAVRQPHQMDLVQTAGLWPVLESVSVRHFDQQAVSPVSASSKDSRAK